MVTELSELPHFLASSTSEVKIPSNRPVPSTPGLQQRISSPFRTTVLSAILDSTCAPDPSKITVSYTLFLDCFSCLASLSYLLTSLFPPDLSSVAQVRVQGKDSRKGYNLRPRTKTPSLSSLSSLSSCGTFSSVSLPASQSVSTKQRKRNPRFASSADSKGISKSRKKPASKSKRTLGDPKSSDTPADPKSSDTPAPRVLYKDIPGAAVLPKSSGTSFPKTLPGPPSPIIPGVKSRTGKRPSRSTTLPIARRPSSVDATNTSINRARSVPIGEATTQGRIEKRKVGKRGKLSQCNRNAVSESGLEGWARVHMAFGTGGLSLRATMEELRDPEKEKAMKARLPDDYLNMSFRGPSYSPTVLDPESPRNVIR